MENIKLIVLMVSLLGAVGGAFLEVTVHPETNFYYLMPIFALLGIIAADVILWILYATIKS